MRQRSANQLQRYRTPYRHLSGLACKQVRGHMELWMKAGRRLKGSTDDAYRFATPVNTIHCPQSHISCANIILGWDVLLFFFGSYSWYFKLYGSPWGSLDILQVFLFCIFCSILCLKKKSLEDYDTFTGITTCI